MADERKPIRTLVACDHAEYRDAIASLLDAAPLIDLIAKREQGEEGLHYVKRTEPEALVLGISPTEDCEAHGRMYRKEFDGPIVGFAFDEDQHAAYRRAGIQKIIDGGASSAELVEAILARCRAQARQG